MEFFEQMNYWHWLTLGLLLLAGELLGTAIKLERMDIQFIQ